MAMAAGISDTRYSMLRAGRYHPKDAIVKIDSKDIGRIRGIRNEGIDKRTLLTVGAGLILHSKMDSRLFLLASLNTSE